MCWLGLYTVYLVIMSMEKTRQKPIFLAINIVSISVLIVQKTSFVSLFEICDWNNTLQKCCSMTNHLSRYKQNLFSLKTYKKSGYLWCNENNMLTCCDFHIKALLLSAKTTLSITVLFQYTGCHYAVCRILFIVMLNVVMLHDSA